MDKTIISICGGSGSGKSLLAKTLAEQLGAERAVRIPSDFYLQSNPYPTPAEFFQHPLVYDWDLLTRAMEQPLGTTISTPTYDFITFQRIACESGRPFTLQPVCIVDAMVPYPNADFTILLQCPEEERRRRIMARDTQWQTQVISYWDLHQVTLQAVMCEPSHFDLILDGRNAPEANAGRIRAMIAAPRGVISGNQPA